MKRLRSKIESVPPSPIRIVTVRGVCYRYETLAMLDPLGDRAWTPCHSFARIARLARAPKKPRCCVEQCFDQAFPGRLDADDPARKTNLFNPPMPDASSPLFGVLIAGQYRNWRGVLFDLLNEPHTPKRKLWDDEPYSSLKGISRSDVTIAAPRTMHERMNSSPANGMTGFDISLSRSWAATQCNSSGTSL